MRLERLSRYRLTIMGAALFAVWNDNTQLAIIVAGLAVADAVDGIRDR